MTFRDWEAKRYGGNAQSTYYFDLLDYALEPLEQIET